jgi:hypothetical protein
MIGPPLLPAPPSAGGAPPSASPPPDELPELLELLELVLLEPPSSPPAVPELLPLDELPLPPVEEALEPPELLDDAELPGPVPPELPAGAGEELWEQPATARSAETNANDIAFMPNPAAKDDVNSANEYAIP